MEPRHGIVGGRPRRARHWLSSRSLWIAAVTLCALCSEVVAVSARLVCDVTRFGAEGTVTSDDTEAFQRAIDACAPPPGGTVLVPAGEYLVGPLYLRSNIRLQLQSGSRLAGATEEALYKATETTRAYVSNGNWIALINVADAENVAIVGEGTIDGQGAAWWERWRKAGGSGPTNRPRLIHVARSRNVRIEGVTLLNSPSFHVVLKDSENITVRGTTIRAPVDSPNTDAIDPIDSRKVLIANNTFDVGDDVVAIKSLGVDAKHPDAAAADIVVRNNTCLAGRGISIGSETIGGVRNVLVEGNVIRGAMYGIRIKTPRGKGGEVSDVIFRDNRMENVATPLVFSGYYESKPQEEAEISRRIASGGFVLNNQIYPDDTDAAQPYARNSTPYIRNVTVSGLTATGATRAGIIVGLPERAIDNVRFENVQIESAAGLLVRHADVSGAKVQLSVREGKAVIEEKGSRVRLQ